MVKIIILDSLKKEINKVFKKESIKIFELMLSLKNNPQKGKLLGVIGNIIIKELKYKTFRFYFITNGYKIKYLKTKDLEDLIIKFIRMSDKKNQQKVIDEIKVVLSRLGEEGF